MSNLAASAVALVVLLDLATGQGPPVYTNYLQQQEGYLPPPPPPPLHPVGYIHRNEFDGKKLDKEYEKAIELGKVPDLKDRKKFEKEFEKGYGKGGKDYDKEFYKQEKDKEGGENGMLSSLSNRVSGAWSEY